ncbi:PIN domain-containing protein [Paenibacillus abyssi]|uniref:Uncharacterized protein n=1 Tax=Paenibacillus abyssi TaxID=1340531 RepID=A0A917G1C5_9BACL|nr:PIN domain-containing protein [Paenibacillus abyssi]GGG17603.1 hypothetical protein GCM10010916_38040 [Paenibacillus abyssi]
MDMSLLTAAGRLFAIFLLVKFIIFFLEISFNRKPRQMNNELPKTRQEGAANFKANTPLYDVMANYLETGYSLALDAQFLLKHNDAFFRYLDLIFEHAGGNVLISDGVLKEIEELRKRPETGILANNLLDNISEAISRYPKRLEVISVDDGQSSTFGMNDKDKLDRLLAPYVLADKYRLTKVLLMSGEVDKQNRAVKHGLAVHSV